MFGANYLLFCVAVCGGDSKS